MSRSTARLLLLAAAGFQLVFGLAVMSSIAGSTWLVDATRYLQAAGDLEAGRYGIDRAYLYSPLAAWLTIPATWLPAAVAGLLWLGARLIVVTVCVAVATRGRDPAVRALVLVGVIAFVPTLQDLMLGNVSVLLAAAVALVAWSRDRVWTGLPLGLALATVPKPALIPILVWMLFFRRRSLAGAVAGAAVATLLGLLVLGVGPYETWIDVLRHPLYFEGGQAGNLALNAFFPTPVTLALDAVALAAFGFALRRGETSGLVGALAVGLLVAPYTIAYGAVFLLLALRPLTMAIPIIAVAALAIAAPILVIVFLPALAAIVLLAATAMPSRSGTSPT